MESSNNVPRVSKYRSTISRAQYRSSYDINSDLIGDCLSYPSVQEHLQSLRDLLKKAVRNRHFTSLADEARWNESPEAEDSNGMCFEDMGSKLHFHLYDSDLSRQAKINDTLNSSHFRVAQESEEYLFSAEWSTEDEDEPFDDEYLTTRDKLKTEEHSCAECGYVCCVQEDDRKTCFLRRRCAHAELPDIDISCAGKIMTTSQIAYGNHVCRNMLVYVKRKSLRRNQLILMTSVRKATTQRTSDSLFVANIASQKMHILPKNPMKFSRNADPDINLSFNNNLTSTISELFEDASEEGEHLGFTDLVHTDTTEVQDVLSRHTKLGEHMRPPKKRVKWSLRHYMVMAVLLVSLFSIPMVGAEQPLLLGDHTKILDEVAFEKRGVASINAFAPIKAIKTIDMRHMIEHLATLMTLSDQMTTICRQYGLVSNITERSLVYMGAMMAKHARKACDKVGKMMVLTTNPRDYNRTTAKLIGRLAPAEWDSARRIIAPVFLPKRRSMFTWYTQDGSLAYTSMGSGSYVNNDCRSRLRIQKDSNHGPSGLASYDRATYYHSHKQLCVTPADAKGHVFCTVAHYQKWQASVRSSYATCTDRVVTIQAKLREVRRQLGNHLHDEDTNELLKQELTKKEEQWEDIRASPLLGQLWNFLNDESHASANSRSNSQSPSERGRLMTNTIMSYIGPSIDKHLLEGTKYCILGFALLVKSHCPQPSVVIAGMDN